MHIETCGLVQILILNKVKLHNIQIIVTLWDNVVIIDTTLVCEKGCTNDGAMYLYSTTMVYWSWH